jgi:hypothetical protein
MSDMSNRHRHPASPVPSAWGVLFAMGAASVTCQMWHSAHSGSNWLFAVIEGLAPIGASMGLSHAAALLRQVRWWMYALVYLIILAAMGLSANAIAQVVAPAEGPWGEWLFGGMLDGAALVALAIILNERNRQAARATAEESACGQLAGAHEAIAALQAERARLETELATASAALDALRSAAPPPAPKRSRKSAKSAHGSADTQDLTAELRAIQMLDAHPELRAKGHGADLGRRLGVSPAHGRRLHARLTSEERSDDALQERSPQGSDERAGERS